MLLAAIVAAGNASAASGPSPTTRPTISGDASQGSRLVISRGTWSGSGRLTFEYRWYRCDPMGRHCQLLHGVNTAGHRAGANDVGHTLSAAVLVTDKSGTRSAYASLVGPIAGPQPRIAPLAQPVISGSPVKGGTLHVDAGRWRPKPSGLAFQWARCNADLRSCAAIKGATAATHDVDDADLGHALVAIVQARAGVTSRAIFSTATNVAVASGATSTGPTVDVAPAIAEVLQQGSRLTGAVGAWTGTGTVAYAYSWYRCDGTGAHCKAIRGADEQTYLQTARDVGHTLGFAVHATDTTGTTTAYAPLVGPVAAPDAPLVSTGPPSVAGTPTTGQALQVSPGSWSRPPSALAYQWQRCNANGRLCTAIAGATAAAYTVTGDDAGHRLLAVVHATAGTAVQDAFSIATPVVGAVAPAGPSLSAPPTVAGTAAQRAQLTGTVGTWSGAGTIAYTFNWFRCDTAGAHCVSIHGATKATYTQSAKDVGHTIGFAVHAADGNGSATAYASLVGPVAAPGTTMTATAQPAITGTAAPGQTLQVSVGSWSQTPASVTYQWQRCNANGRLCASITGATAATYAVTAADTGRTLVVVVTASLNGVQQAAVSTHSALVP